MEGTSSVGAGKRSGRIAVGRLRFAIRARKSQRSPADAGGCAAGKGWRRCPRREALQGQCKWVNPSERVFSYSYRCVWYYSRWRWVSRPFKTRFGERAATRPPPPRSAESTAAATTALVACVARRRQWRDVWRATRNRRGRVSVYGERWRVAEVAVEE